MKDLYFVFRIDTQLEKSLNYLVPLPVFKIFYCNTYTCINTLLVSSYITHNISLHIYILLHLLAPFYIVKCRSNIITAQQADRNKDSLHSEEKNSTSSIAVGSLIFSVKKSLTFVTPW